MKSLNLSGLANALGASQELQKAGISNGDELIEINPFDVAFDKTQPRKRIRDGWIVELAEMIRSAGLQQPPVVELRSPGDNAEQLLIVKGDPAFVHRLGECRIRAFQYLQTTYPDDVQYSGYTKMPVIKREYVSREGMSKNAVVKIGQIIENKGREQPDAVDEAEAILDLVNEIGREKTVEALGESGKKVTESWVSKRLALAKVPSSVHWDCDANDISDMEARVLLGRIYEENKEAYDDLIHDYQEGKINAIRESAAQVWREVSKKEPPVKGGGSRGGVGSLVDKLPNEDSDSDEKVAQREQNKRDYSDLVDKSESAAEEQLELLDTIPVADPVADNSITANRLMMGKAGLFVWDVSGNVTEISLPDGVNVSISIKD
ncbi:ParB-like chromosome segregation protein Spo0J [Rheinheimera pacifica]|uniref:ParB/RepB/Spo0J family partition protein n=1 Tax=Rheinheimera pacifica TaxID=173990 RepID=UPI00216716BB|nr:hypothetical protein [Rheinheimera pacifica]MCS4309484.1 ParB-like chromosome segregation protein Spo0J [Rheinheimera pacifica]